MWLKNNKNLVCLYKDRTAVFSHRITFYIRSWGSAFSFKTWARIINVPLFFHLAAKRLMAHLPSSSWVNTTEGPCWLLHAVTWEWGSTVVLTRWIWTPQRQACHSANHSICLETQYGRLGCVLEKTPGEPPLASQLSLVALSLLFFFFSL